MRPLFISLFLGLFSLSSLASLPAAINEKPLPSLSPMLKMAVPAVVNIATEGRAKIAQSPLMNDPFFRFFFDAPSQRPRTRKTQSLGSGVIVDAKNGYIITNAHVIQSAHTINITLHNGKTHRAELLGADPATDIAVLKINAKNLTALPLADSDQLDVGDFVVAIGNPFGLGQTVTSGIVSALGRSGLGIEGYEDFIQTDASINPGNSGGALVNLHGHLVGMNTAILAPSGGNVGIGFAIPTNMVATLMQQIIEFGEVRRGILGVSMQDISDDLKDAFGAHKISGGALVTEVTPEQAADKAGLQAGDIVLSVNNKAVRHAADVRNAIGLMRIGESFTMQVFRSGQFINLSVVIGQPQRHSVEGKTLHPNLVGATLTEQLRDGESKTIITISDVEHASPAWRTGMRKNDVILSANRRKLDSLETLKKAVAGKRQLLLNIKRGDGAFYLVIK